MKLYETYFMLREYEESSYFALCSQIECPYKQAACFKMARILCRNNKVCQQAIDRELDALAMKHSFPNEDPGDFYPGGMSESEHLREGFVGFASATLVSIFTIMLIAGLIKAGIQKRRAEKIIRNNSAKIKSMIEKKKKEHLPKILKIGQQLYRILMGPQFKKVHAATKKNALSDLKNSKDRNYISKRYDEYVKQILYNLFKRKKITKADKEFARLISFFDIMPPHDDWGDSVDMGDVPHYDTDEYDRFQRKAEELTILFQKMTHIMIEADKKVYKIIKPSIEELIDDIVGKLKD